MVEIIDSPEDANANGLLPCQFVLRDLQDEMSVGFQRAFVVTGCRGFLHKPLAVDCLRCPGLSLIVAGGGKSGAAGLAMRPPRDVGLE